MTEEKTTRKPFDCSWCPGRWEDILMKEFASSAYRQFAIPFLRITKWWKMFFRKTFDVERILMAIQLVDRHREDTETLIISWWNSGIRGLTVRSIFKKSSVSCGCSRFLLLYVYAVMISSRSKLGRFMDLYPLLSEFLEAVGQEAFARLLAKDWGWSLLFRREIDRFAQTALLCRRNAWS